MTPEELKAIKDAAAAGGTDDELNAKLEALVNAVKVTNKGAEDEAKIKAAKEAAENQKVAADALAEVKKAADIKQMLTDNGNKKIDYSELETEDILNIVSDAFETSMDAKLKLVLAEMSNPMTQLNGKVDDIQKYLIQAEAQQGVQDARNKYPDYDEFKEEMDKIWVQYPGISTDHAYILAKGQKSAELPSRDIVASEKPISLATRQANAQTKYDKKENKGGLGPRGFKALLDEKASMVISQRRT